MISKVERCMDKILDVLIEEGGFFTAPWGQVLKDMACRAFDDDTIKVGSNPYFQTSQAVIRLEAMEFISVTRQNRDEPEKANVIEAIRLL